VTISGYTHTVRNFANSSTFTYGNASGLRIVHTAANTDWTGSVDTGPGVRAKLSTFYSSVRYQPLRLWFRLSLVNADANYEVARVGLTNDSGTTFNWHVFKGGVGTAGATAFGYALNIGGSNTINTFPDTSNTSHDVIMIEVDHMGSRIMRWYTGTWSGGWPSEASLTFRGEIYSTGTASPGTMQPSNVCMQYCATTLNTNGTLETRLLNFKLETHE
jgi:hypothetical protein